VVPALLTTLLQMAGLFVVYAVLGSYLTGRFGSTPAWISATLLAFGVAGVLGNASVGLVAPRLGADRLLGLSLASSAVVAFLLLVAPRSAWVGLLLFAVWSVVANMFQAPQQARLIRLNPPARGLMLALNAAVLYLGISLGSGLGSALLPVLGAVSLAWPALLMLVAAFLLGRVNVGANNHTPEPVQISGQADRHFSPRTAGTFRHGGVS